MADNLEKQIDKYLKRVGRYIICEKETKERLLVDISDSVYSYAEQHGISDMEEIYRKFGTPKNLASQHLCTMDPDKLLNFIRIKKLLLVTVAVALMMLAVFFVTTYVDAHNSYYTNLDVTLTYEPITTYEDIKN